MTLKEKIHQDLERFVGRFRGESAVQRFVLDTEAGPLESQLTALDAIGCAFTHFTLRTDRLSGASVDQLTQVGTALSARLGYLLEPIGPLEVDPQGCVVQLRSFPPQKDEEGTSYYELLVRGDQLSLCRYTKSPGRPRQAVPAQVTREVFQRLAADFIAAVA